jgi:ElaB/YqjD/DUF883 family membrane-anchored ribosome-binding protein
MSVKAEELEIVIKGNIKDAVQKLDYLKYKINNVLDKQAKALQPSMDAMNKTMVRNAKTTSDRMSIANREIDLQKEKIKQLTKQYDKYLNYRSLKRRAEKGDVNAQFELSQYGKAPKNVYNQLEQAEIRLQKMELAANQTAGKLQKKLVPALKDVKKNLKGVSKDSISATRIFKRMALSMLIGRVIRTAINEAIKGFQDLARYSSKFNDTMSMMQSQLITTRNSLSVAFEPIMHAIAPAVEWLTDKVIALFNALSRLGTILFTNNKSYNIAKKVTSDYAQSLGDAQKAQEGMLAGFDELNVIANQNAGAGTGLPDASEMFETIELDRDNVEGTDRLTKSLFNLRKELEKYTTTLFDGLKWFYDNLLKPLAQFVINDVLPIFFDTLAESIKIAGIVIDNVRPVLEFLWDNFLEPIASWTGGVLITTLELMYDHFKNFADLLSGEINFGEFLQRTVDTWKKAWESIQKISEELWQNLKDGFYVLGFVIVTGFENMWQSIKDVWGAVADWFNKTVVQPISNFFSKLWEGMKIAFKATINFFIDKINNFVIDVVLTINKVISMINKAISSINSMSGEVGVYFDYVDILKLPDLIPRLASGAVLTQETLFVGGEYAGASSNPEIVAPQSMMYETNMKANVPVMNAIEELGDKITEGLSNISVYADFGYDKLRVGLNKENKRIGQKAYGGGY